MNTVADLAAWLERFAPASIAEDWDNVGLLLGDPASELRRVMTCLTVTPRTADEAIADGADAIVSHHPILFRGAKSIRSDRSETGPTWRLARAGIAVLSPHTSFDNTIGGINDGIAQRLGLVDVAPLRPTVRPRATGRLKVVVFTPREAREAVLEAAFGAGAGQVGAYRDCSFASEGIGSFTGGPGSNPTIGESGRPESVAELRIEVACPAPSLGAVLKAIRRAHPYEEPAIDVIPLAEDPNSATAPAGSGRVGQLAIGTTLAGLAGRVKGVLGAGAVQFVGDSGRRVERLAIVCGAGDDFLPDALRASADVLLTGEARFHRALEAESTGIGLIVAGHYSTERPGVEDLAGLIARDLAPVECWASRREEDPLRSA